MTEQEILDEITVLSTAITHLLKVGQEYEVGTGASKRTFKYADLSSMRDYRRELQRQLATEQDCGGGMVLQY